MAVRTDDLNEAKAVAQLAVFTSIASEVEKLTSTTLGTAGRASALRDLALAYRYAAGGQQPGSVTVEK